MFKHSKRKERSRAPGEKEDQSVFFLSYADRKNDESIRDFAGEDYIARMSGQSDVIQSVGQVV